MKTLSFFQKHPPCSSASSSSSSSCSSSIDDSPPIPSPLSASSSSILCFLVVFLHHPLLPFFFKWPFISVFLSFFLSFCFPFLFNILPPSLSIARSLVRSFLHTPHRWLAIPIPLSLGSFSWLFSCFRSFYRFHSVVSLVLPLLLLLLVLSFLSLLSPTTSYIILFFPFFSSPYFLVHILYISSPLSSFFLTSSQSFPFNFAFVVVLFPNPSSCLSTPAIPSSCHASFFLSFPIFTILLLFVLSFYISFLLALLTFSSHFSTPFSCFFFTDDYSLVLVLIILSLSSYHSSTCSVNLVLLWVSHPTAVLLSPFR